jgi:hypothetical protein
MGPGLESDAHLNLIIVARACAGLSHPPTPSTIHGRRLETMTDGTTLNLIHGDLHGDNIMIGKQYDSPTFPEHTLLPPMKLIDLGEAYEGGPGAAAENIHKVSLVRENSQQSIIRLIFLGVTFRI